MNSSSSTIDKSMNGIKTLTDGELTITGGSIIFGDGSVLDSIENLTLLNADNVMTGDNTFNNNITAPSVALLGTHLTNLNSVNDAISTETERILADNNYFTGNNSFNENVYTLAIAPTLDSHLTRKDYVDSEIATETTDFLTRNNTFSGNNTLTKNISVVAEIPVLDSHLTRKDYVDSEIINETTEFLTRNNTFTGSNTFSQSLITTGITNTGNFSNTGTINNMNFLKKANGFIISDTTHPDLTGSFNNSIGVGANKNVSTGEGNNAIGNNSMFSNMTGSSNTAVGQGSGGINQTGSYNTYLGASSQVLLSGYSFSTALGAFSQITDNNQVVLGRNNDTTYVKIPSTKGSSLYTNGALVVDGGVGIAKDLRVNGLFASAGAGSFQQGLTITGLLNCNTGVGITGDLTISGTVLSDINTDKRINRVRIMGSINTTNQNSIIIDTGNEIIGNLVNSSEQNFIFGKNNLTAYQSGTNNVAIGLQNLQAITTNSYNTAVGCNIFKAATIGFNTGIGNGVYETTTTGNYNIGVGFDVGKNNTTGSNNIMIGTNSGEFSNGNNCVFIGRDAKTNNLGTYSNSTAIGQGATITASNQMVLGVSGTGLGVVIPSTNSSALAVGGGATFGGNTYTVGMIKTENNVNNKKLVLWDGGENDAPASATSFYGFGINGSTLRFQTPTATSPATYHRFYTGSTLNTEIGNGIVKIPLTTASSNSTNGALVVGGGVGVGGDINTAGDMTFTSADKNIRWTGGSKVYKVEGYWTDNDRYGLSFTANGQVRLHISNTFTSGYIAFGKALTDTTYTDLMKIAYNGQVSITTNISSTNTTTGSLIVAGGAGVAGNLNVGGILTAANIDSAQMFNLTDGFNPAGVSGSLFAFETGVKIINISFSLYATSVGSKTLVLKLLDSVGGIKATFTQNFYFNQTGVHMCWSFNYKTANITSTSLKANVVITGGTTADVNDYLTMTMFNLANNV